MGDRLLTTTQAAKRLGGISRERVRQFIEEGRLPAVRFGQRVWMIQARDLARVQDRKPGRPRKRASPRQRRNLVR